MKNKQKNLLYWGIAVLVVVLIIGGLVLYSNQPGPLDQFAKCLKDKGATFYGAYWCPACNKQKTIFGRSTQYLPYAECSNPGARDQNELCIAAKIEAYPTWEFEGGERITGVLSPEKLSEKTGCALPQ